MPKDGEMMYVITIKREGKEELEARQELPVLWVNNARRSLDVGLRQKVADRVYRTWCQSVDGRKNKLNGGVPFTYEQLRIRKAPQSCPPPEQLTLFE